MNSPAPASFDGVTVYVRLAAYLRQDWKILMVGLLGFAVYAATQAGAAWWLEQFVNAVEQNRFDQRGYLAGLILAVFFVRGVGWLFGSYSFAHVARSLVNRLRTQMFDHLLVLPSIYYQRHSTAELTSKLIYNAEQVTGAATGALKTVISEGLTVLGLFGYMLYLNWRLTLLFMAILPLIGWVVRFASKRLRRLSQNIQSSVSDISASASEAIHGYQVVRIFGGAQAERERFGQASERNRRQFMKLVVTDSVSTPVVQMLVAGVVALLTYLAMSPSFLGAMSTGAFIAFISTAAMMAKPVRSLTEVNATIQKGIAAADSFFSLFDEAPEVDTGDVKLGKAQGDIVFDRVGFTYPNATAPAIRSVSLHVPAGSTVALVGRSGSGKSTLSSLIPRFFDVSEGQIRLDGQAIDRYTLESLRQQIALVNQQVVLFEGTIAANIAYGALASASPEAIAQAADAAQVTEFTQHLPDGLNTMVGENGLLLSGGQRQRIAIARAILKDAPILILDEATSALDSESERHIQRALEHLMQNRTTLIIAHRLSTIEKADQIVVMEHGQVLEQGTHHELLALGGHYWALHRLQFADGSSPA
ncbi:MdlB ABC-type multidrug transport system, ATPase and permease components [Burkholderiaceae bacterium]